MEPPIHQDITRCSSIGPQELILEAHILDNLQNGISRAETLRAQFKQESILLDRLNDSADSIGFLQQKNRHSRLAQPVGAGEPGDAAAHYNDL